MTNYETYESPFCTRYASEEMQFTFSAQKKFSTFRRLWVALARAEMKLGLEQVTQEKVDELEAHIDDIDFAYAAEEEKKLRHDVMAHVHTYGKCCPKAEGIIHLGATSCYVGDNTDVIVMRDAMKIVHRKLVNVLANFASFADKYKDMPCLAYTHLQPAQLTTVGKRATLWMNELLMDLEDLEYQMGNLKLLGQKGTTGTQASFMELFHGDEEKIEKLEQMIAEEMGFKECVPVSGQTYSRKVDSRIVNVLGGIAQSCSKFSNDLRILASGPKAGFGEITLPAMQNGSSIMPGKVNPVIPEVVSQVAFHIIGHDTTITMAAEAGQMELNAFEPVVFYNLFDSITTLTHAVDTLTANCILGITANEKRCRELLDASVGITTALCPYIGYKKAASLAKESLKTDIPVKTLVLKYGLLKENELDSILDPYAMTEARTKQTQAKAV